MTWWLLLAGTGERPYTEQDRLARPARHRFPRRPRIARGDQLVIYAAGSAREYGEAGRERARDEFSWGAIADTTRALYTELTS